ncbi:GntR family transcriptional regulator [Kocuria coralli]|uniref:GntR family transcriptional regulator n=1 Tax=Kocuria coralli TaxID=1461025 RepID=A0A5J5KWN5_9MICC|nr:GntR family transcriptional regulator [Kocuria coralli]KAA9393236.1 GntR family transcriptional regulator [Kocuria coralli]
MTDPQLISSPLGTRVSVRRHVVDNLRAALISGELRPGETYSAPSLAKKLGVSATPVREAMLDFSRDGMVEVVPNTGFKVTAVDERQLDEIAETRLLLEVPVMGAVAEACTGEVAAAVEALRPLAARLSEAAAAGDLVDYMEADTEFHTRFLALHGNREVVDYVRRLRSRSRLYGLQALADAGVLEETTSEHGKMIEIALERDRTAMEDLVRQHIGHVRGVWAQ